LKIMRRCPQREPVQRNDFFPGQLVDGTPAHGANIGAVCRTHLPRRQFIVPGGNVCRLDCLAGRRFSGISPRPAWTELLISVDPLDG
jgi:hypothetical protein